MYAARNLLLFSSLVAAVYSSPVGPAAAANHVTHEKRDVLPHGWAPRERLASGVRLPLRIGLKQRNLHLGPQFLDEVSNPRSEKYAQHWSQQDIIDTFSPSEETISAVLSWLSEAEIDPDRVSLTRSRAWVHVDATVEEAEKLLQTEYYIYEHSLGQSHIACEEYSLPAELSADHVDIILPSVHFDAKITQPRRRAAVKRQIPVPDPDVSGADLKNVGLFTGHIPKILPQPDVQALTLDNTTCDQFIVPECLRLLYNFGNGTLDNSSYGIVEYTPQSYLAEDLDLFFKNFSSNLIGQRPIFASIAGGVLQRIQTGFDLNAESALDLEYAMALVAPQKVTLYQVGDLVQGASFNNFLDGIDGSYCTFQGGDDPDYDGIYPNPLRGGYKKQDCGIFTPASVISTSYGYNEVDLPPSYEQRQCSEYLKLGLQGVTILYSSGDNGVGGNGGQCVDANGTLNDGTTGAFTPSFPGGCPYVTSVGATEVPEGVDVAAAIASGIPPETAADFTGGGFSNVFTLPEYQSEAVTSYLTTVTPDFNFTAAQFNNSGSARAFPDVSANGASYVIAVIRQFALVFGTSASSPAFGSVVTLINEQLAAAGKKPVGFINPVLYANPGVMNDIVNGTNPGCGTEGFSASAGWDPVTGLGTPNYEKMVELFLSLQ